MEGNEMIAFTIDGKDVVGYESQTILHVAEENGIYIPHLCDHKDLTPVGHCRLCLVEVDGWLSISCKTQIREGMSVRTENPEIIKTRKITLELIVANHPRDCLTCVKDSECQLQEVSNYIGIDEDRLARLRPNIPDIPIDTSNPFFDRDLEKCILCGICVRTCEEVIGVSAIDFSMRGVHTTISTFGDAPILDSNCVSCGECVANCPVGALIPKKEMHVKPAYEVLTTCPYCGCGCGIYLGVRGDEIVSTRGERGNPASLGNLCVKGRYGLGFVTHPDRLTTPLIKRDGKFHEATWDEALDLVARKMLEIKEEITENEDYFGFIASAKCTNEDNYVMQKFARAAMGTNNVDHCARLCHAPTVTGLVQSFGSGAMTNSIDEVKNSKCFFAIGTNTTSAHPIIANRINEAVRKGAKLIVANPREIDLCKWADLFLQFNPGTDVPLMMGMAKIIVDEGLADAAFIQERCEGFDDFKKSLNRFPLEEVERITGVPGEKIVEAARMYASNSPASILYAMGVTQHSHGTDNVLATANLALLTGNVGKESSGVNPLRGQNNVQGACDVGSLPNVYPGYQRVHVPEIKEKFETAWGTGLSGKAGLAMTEMFNVAHEGKLKAIYLVGENPVLSDADANHITEAIQKLDFFVVQDIFLTETAEMADVVLPATSFAEKDGTFTNTERRVQRVRKVLNPRGESRGDWEIVSEVARRMGVDGFDFKDSSAVLDEIASVSPIYGGIHFDRIENVGLQWPCTDRNHPGTKYLHSEGFATGNSKGQFKSLVYKPPMELPDEEYPLVLTTERSLYHYHTGTMTRRVEGLNVLRRNELVEMNPKDAEMLGIEDGDTVRVVSRRGEVETEARVTEVSPEGVVSMTFHFAESPTNQLTNNALDPESKIPETKVCAVRIEKISGSYPDPSKVYKIRD
jgi:formate dehydrogenase alpha subunit